MAFYEELLPGSLNTCTSNSVYALPSRVCQIFANKPIELCNDTSFSSVLAVSTNTNTVTAAAFLRSTTADALVRICCY